MSSEVSTPYLAFPMETTLNLRVGAANIPSPIGFQSASHTQFPMTINSGLTILIGPNGSGKTHILRALQSSFGPLPPSKQTRFISAGRIGLAEQYRAVHNAHAHQPDYESASFGDWNNRANRYRLETLEGDYQNIAERPDIQLKIRERLRKLFKKDITLRWENGRLKVEFSVDEAGAETYSAAREASGLVHLVGLLSAIYDDKVGLLLLDEPEVSLHPQLQAFLLREIMGVAGLPTERNKKIVVISTHSTEFLKVDHPSDLPNLVFTSSVKSPPVQIGTETPELKNKKVAELISRMGQEHKLAFFAKSPLLVEGPSDTIICAGLSSKLDVHLEAGGSQILPVVGKGQFPVVLKLLRLMGKTPIVLADADAFTDGNELAQAFAASELANQAAISMSHDSLIKMYSTAYSAFTRLVDTSWAELRPLAEETLYWKKGTPEDDEAKLKRRAAFSAMFSNHPDALPDVWRNMRTKLAGVLDALEAGGCYILRRGTIEAYYSSHVENVDGKPSAATDEVIAFKQNDAALVEEQYADIIRCLRSAAQTEAIDEAEIVRDVVIAMAAPIIAKMRDAKGIDANRLLQATGHPLASLFDFSQEQGNLVISLNSEILDIGCFPIKINPAEDVVTRISQLMGESKKR